MTFQNLMASPLSKDRQNLWIFGKTFTKIQSVIFTQSWPTDMTPRQTNAG